MRMESSNQMPPEEKGVEKIPRPINVPPKPPTPEEYLNRFFSAENMKKEAEGLGQMLRSMPPEKSRRILTETFADILKNQRRSYLQQGKRSPKVADIEFQNSPAYSKLSPEEIRPVEEDKFRKNKYKCLTYLDELEKKGRFILGIRLDIANGNRDNIASDLDLAVTLKDISPEEAGIILEMLGIEEDKK